MSKRLLNRKPWLIGEMEFNPALELLRNVVYSDQGSPEQNAAIDLAWKFLNPEPGARAASLLPVTTIWTSPKGKVE